MQDGKNDLQLVRHSLRVLSGAGARCWIFGGWAEELRGLSPARPHNDIDLLYRGADFAAVERLFRDRSLEELEAKRFAHKRAFLLENVVVELFLVQQDPRGLFTNFWDCARHDWPLDVLATEADLPVASAAALAGYRARHQELRAQRPERSAQPE